MMPAESRPTWQTAAVAVGLVLLSVWCVGRLQSSKSEAAMALDDLHACQRLTARISQLQVQPARAGLQAGAQTELASYLEAAAEAAELPFANVLLVEPLPPERIRNSSYLEQSTRLELELVTMKQLVLLLKELVSERSGLQVESIRLLAPVGVSPSRSQSEVWDAEVTLTQLIFSPTSTR